MSRARYDALWPSQGSLDQPVRFIDRHEDLIAVLKPEWREIHEQAVLVGQRKGNLDNFVKASEHALTDGIKRVLD